MKMHILDLTLPLDIHTPVYANRDGYRDPAFAADRWATVAEQGYSVHRLQMGTHTGTHMDAPAHFHTGGLTIDQLPLSALVGQAVFIDVRPLTRVTALALKPFSESVLAGGLPLFLAPDDGVALSEAAVDAVASWRPRLILYAGQFIDEGALHHHQRVWLGRQIPLVTDLDPRGTLQVQDGDLLIVAPLLLMGLDGSPCRVLALHT